MTDAVAARLRDAYLRRQQVPTRSSQDPAFDLQAAYAVERQLADERVASGRRIAGLKVGYANKALWRALRLQTLVWAHMYDDTVHFEGEGAYTLATSRMIAPRLEPEIVFKLARPIKAGADALTALASVEWLALGFEIVDCVYPEWRFQPADFVAAYGLHAALIIGRPTMVNASNTEALAEQLPAFTVTLSKNDVPVAEGSGRNSLRSPALCLAELAAAVAAAPHSASLGAGDLVSSGTLTDAQPIDAGEMWSAHIDGAPIERLRVTTT